MIELFIDLSKDGLYEASVHRLLARSIAQLIDRTRLNQTVADVVYVDTPVDTQGLSFIHRKRKQETQNSHRKPGNRTTTTRTNGTGNQSQDGRICVTDTKPHGTKRNRQKRPDRARNRTSTGTKKRRQTDET